MLLKPSAFCEKYKSCVEPLTNIYDAETDVSISSTIGKNLIAPLIDVSPKMLTFVAAPGSEPDIVKLPLNRVLPIRVLFPI